MPWPAAQSEKDTRTGLLTIKPWGTQETESISWKHQLDKALLLLPDYLKEERAKASMQSLSV